MARKKNKSRNDIRPQTNVWDVVKALIDGFFNFISLSKVAALAILWFIIRDIIFVLHLPEDYDYAEHLLNDGFLSYLIQNDNILIIVLVSIVAFLFFACVSMILYIIFLRNEIKRMATVRSEAIHGKEKINIHTSSELGN
ncbi:hypothetical protein NSA48_06885 [Frisingicoccus caecimuris]|uniref:Uncharacterized protein n=1 Tax=Frisingicoccus caecimuris TaxID=1796636 RepID=A0A4V2SE24_9FIRM|nr:hypothetical protein [Frisingicoccus caecimuris]MCR1918756.1 hypothetical protein [Frisingicoccus caecimuris]TCO86388.1 hypothetical protein EV212_101173 [Frisingicoccus caecimuris]